MFVIRSTTPNDSGTLDYWSNDDGWTESLDCATLFTEEEKDAFRHIPEGGEWISCSSGKPAAKTLTIAHVLANAMENITDNNPWELDQDANKIAILLGGLPDKSDENATTYHFSDGSHAVVYDDGISVDI